MTSHELLLSAPVYWREKVESLSSDERHKFADDLNHLAQCAALLATYLEERTEMNNHETAVKKANKVKIKVRKALGYSYPAGSQFTW